MATATKKQPVKKPLSNQEKLLYGGGIALLIGGGIVWYVRSKKDKDLEESTDYGDTNTAINPPVSNTPKTPSSATPTFVNNTTPKPVDIAPVRSADVFRYAIGQEVKANILNGTQTYEVIGTSPDFQTNGIKKAKFNYGDKIGTIIWAGTMPNGTYRYVVKRVGNFGNIDNYWVSDNRTIKPTGKIIKTISSSGSQIDKNKLLKFGSTGLEVKTLQVLLKIPVDKGIGVFGKNTRNALMNQKKLVEIRLKDWK